MKNSPPLNVNLSRLGKIDLTSASLPPMDVKDLFRYLQLSLEYAADEVFWMRSDSEIFYVNEAACQKLGYTREELVGMKVWEWDPLFPKEVWPTFWNDMREKKQVEFETKHQNKNGTVFPVRIKAHFIENGDEEILFAFVTDITEKIQRQEQLEQLNEQIRAEVEAKTAELQREKEITLSYSRELEKSNHRYNLAIEGTGVGLWTWDVQTNGNYWSPKFFQLLGFADEEIFASYDEWEARLHPDDKDSVLSALQAHLKDGVKYEVELRLRRKNDTYHWYRVKGKAEFNKDGIATYMVGSLEDIQEQKTLQAAYMFEQQKFREFVNLAPVGIAINRMKDGSFEYVNNEFSKFTGYDVDVLNSMDYWQLTPKQYEDQEQLQLQNMKSEGRYGPYLKEYFHKDGHRFPVLLSGIKITGLDGAEYIWSVVQDMTERQKAEEQLRVAMREAEAANVAKSQFLAAMSHEIRTPMNGILGTLQLLQDDFRSDKERMLFDSAVESAHSLLTIVNDILDFSKIEANMLSLEYVTFSAKHIVKHVVSSLSQLATVNSVNVEVSESPGFHDAWIGDSTRVKQIVTNVVSNAIKFSENGSVSIAIASQLGGENTSLTIVVKDTGIGMSSETLSSLFDRFTQADLSTTRKFGGTGLGMAITKNLVDMMNGTIHISSELSVGTTVEIVLPLNCSQSDVRNEESKRSDAPNLTGKKILVAEDNQVNLMIIETMLEKTNATIVTAENGAVAVELFESSTPDLVLMDIQMPEMDGLDACKIIKKKSPNTPVVALTANVLLEDVQTYLQNGFNDHLGKPVVLDQLYERLEKYLLNL